MLTSLGSGGGILEPARFFNVSQTWTCDFSGMYQICIVGAGGSGGAIGIPYKEVSYPAASGGGGGGFCLKNAYIQKNETLTLTIGAGGARIDIGTFVVAKPQNSELEVVKAFNGNSSGTTSVIGTSINMVVTGGGGGLYTTTMNTTISGGTGGVATGGDLNRTGGNGADATSLNTVYTKPPHVEVKVGAASGGGSIGNVYGNGCTGAAAINNSVSSMASGGGALPIYSDTGNNELSLIISGSTTYNPILNRYFPFMLHSTFNRPEFFIGTSGSTSNTMTSDYGANMVYRNSSYPLTGGGGGAVCYNGWWRNDIDFWNYPFEVNIKSDPGGQGLISIQRIG